MRIPKSIKIMGQTIRIEFVSNLAQEDDDWGQAVYRKSLIRIQPSCDGHERTREQIEQTFCHELTHWILYKMKSKKNDDEKFVDVFAGLLHQALNSAEGELKA